MRFSIVKLKRLLTNLVTGAGLLAFAAATHAAAPVFRVTLLGTGTPTPEADRAGPAVLAEVGGLVLLFDAGRNTVVRLKQAGIVLNRLDAVFLTHLHSDHVVGLPDLLLTSRIPADYGMRTAPLAIFGPIGTAHLAHGIVDAFSADIAIREKSQKLAPGASTFLASEFSTNGVIFERSGVRVSAFEVDHGPGIRPAFGFRIEADGHAVVISGDTTFDARVANAGKGSDLLIHEVVCISQDYIQKFPAMAVVTTYHTTPQQAGLIFEQAKPKLAVLTHLGFIGGTRPADIVPAVRETYKGALVVGEDLMSFDIADGIAIYSRRTAQ